MATPTAQDSPKTAPRRPKTAPRQHPGPAQFPPPLLHVPAPQGCSCDPELFGAQKFLQCCKSELLARPLAMDEPRLSLMSMPPSVDEDAESTTTLELPGPVSEMKEINDEIVYLNDLQFVCRCKRGCHNKIEFTHVPRDRNKHFRC